MYIILEQMKTCIVGICRFFRKNGIFAKMSCMQFPEATACYFGPMFVYCTEVFKMYM